MSSTDKKSLIASIATTLLEWQDACDASHEAFREFFGLSQVERRCLFLVFYKRQTLNAIAKQTFLTPSGVTSLIDRLEARELVKRHYGNNDRQEVFVSITDEAQKLMLSTFARTQRKAMDILTTYSTEELLVIQQFLKITFTL